MGSILSEGSRSSCEIALASPYLIHWVVREHHTCCDIMIRIILWTSCCMMNIFILRELVSEEGVSEEHLADNVDEVDAVGKQHLSIRKCGFCFPVS